MGLVDRLSADDDSPVARALRLREPRYNEPQENEAPQPASSGAIDAQDRVASELDPGEAVRVLVRQLNTADGFGVTTPSHLFSLLHTYMMVERGALLVHSSEDAAFVPIASTGLDETSRVRLMLSAEELDALGVNERVTIVDDERLAVLKGRLSTTDLARTSRIALFPFKHHRNRLAVLVIFDSPVLDLDSDVLDVALAALAEHAGQLLFDGRERPLGRRDAPAVFLDSERATTVRRRLEEVQRAGNSLACLRISYADLVTAVEEVHPYLERSRLVSDMLQSIAVLLHPRWSVVADSAGHVLIVGPELPSHDPDLLAATIATTMSELFGTGRRVPLVAETLAPDDLIA